MNKQRRKELEEIICELEGLKERLDVVQEEEQDSFDNMPESLQDSERGQTIEENASNLEDCCSNLDELISELNEVLEN